MGALRITIVGGTGFVRRHLRDRLLRAGHWLKLVARHVAEAAASMGIGRLIHISALGVSEDAPSAADRSKAPGERAVSAVFPKGVVLRPSLMFGEDDHFLSRIAAMPRQSPVIPLIGAGTRVQPTHVDSLGEGIARIPDHQSDAAPSTRSPGRRRPRWRDWCASRW